MRRFLGTGRYSVADVRRAQYIVQVIRIHDLPDSAALAAIRDGDFPSEITSRPRVAVLMTQNWCIDWQLMRSWLRRMAKKGEPAERDIDVYFFIYNKVAYFRRFRLHKENSFGNYLIPYLRYYADGSYLGDSNQLSSSQFLARFD